MVQNLTVVASNPQVKHFKNMYRLRFTTTGGAPTETITLNGIDVCAADFIRVLPDPSSQVLTADIIEIKLSRSNANSQIVIGSADGSNLPANVACELIIIKRQVGDPNDSTVLAGNNEDTLFGLRDEGGTGSFNPHSSGTATITSPQITPDSIVWIAQTSQLANLPGGLCEIYSARSTGVSFEVAQADTSDAPNGTVTFDWVTIQP